MKVVINRCYGGFELSNECAITLGAVLKQFGDYFYQEFPNGKCAQDYRTDPKLIHLMETKGSEWCSGSFACLKVVEVPDDIKWEIHDYDGMETIEEVHRSWS